MGNLAIVSELRMICEEIPFTVGYLWIEFNNCVTKCVATYRKQ